MQVCEPPPRRGSLALRPEFHHMTLSILRAVVESQKSLIVGARSDVLSRDATIADQNRMVARYLETITSMGQINRRLQAEAERHVAELKRLRECNAGLVKMVSDLVTASLGDEVESRALFRQILQLAVENPPPPPPVGGVLSPLQPLEAESLDLLKSINLEGEDPRGQIGIHSGDLVSSTAMSSTYASSECIKSPFHVSESNEPGVSWARRGTNEKN